MKKFWTLTFILFLVAALEIPTAVHTRADDQIDCKGAKKGDTLSMIYQWSGEEETKLNNILKPLVDACGIVIKPESTRDQALLTTRVKAGTPPDIGFVADTGSINTFADQLVPLDTLGATKDNYASFFIDPATVNGKWVGLPVKADIKTIIWYSPVVFSAKGYNVPKTWADLDALVEAMVKNGDVPWSTGFESGPATGWTGADFIEDILLVQQGPQYVQDLISGKVPYNDAGVKKAFQTYGKWASDPKYDVDGAQGTLSTNFNTAIDLVFADPPKAMMVRQSGFASGEITTKYPKLQYGTDFDFFPVPEAKGLQGGADWLIAFKNTPAVSALVAYLTSKQGGINWAKASFDLSPNKAAAGNYTDKSLAKKGDALATTTGYVPSIGDALGSAFSNAEWTAIIDYINGKDLDTELANAAKVQVSAVNPASATAAATTAK